MLKCNLRILMALRKIKSTKALMDLTGLNRQTLDKMQDEVDLDTIKLGTFVAVCNVLGCTLSELVEYTPEAEEE